jgi:2-dehydropantoate 2-reductase
MIGENTRISIAIVGPGAIGCIAAAWLARGDRHAVTVCARSPLTDLEIETPDGVLRASPLVLTDPAGTTPVDWVLVATKAYDVESTAPWLARLVGPGTRLAVLQNGVEHVERFRHLVPEERIVPAIVDIPANRTAPGRVTQHLYGSIFVPAGQNGDDFVALFEGGRIAVTADPDLKSRAWQKLCVNAAGAVSTLTLAPTGLTWSPELDTLVRALVEECAAVGRAEGAVIPQAVIEAVIERARTPRPGASRNSMEADRVAGRPMELDARNGVIVRLGVKHGIATPVSSMMVGLLRAAVLP